MRLIDADKIGLTDFEIVMISKESKGAEKWKNALLTIIEKISCAPSVDAVPVVRCRDCKYYRPAERLGRKLPPDCGYFSVGKFLDTDLSPDDFCSRGERRK